MKFTEIDVHWEGPIFGVQRFFGGGRVVSINPNPLAFLCTCKRPSLRPTNTLISLRVDQFPHHCPYYVLVRKVRSVSGGRGVRLLLLHFAR